MNIKKIFLYPTKFLNSNHKEKSETKKIIILLLSSFLFLFLWTNRVKLYPENIFLYLEGKIKSFSLTNEFPVKTEGFECLEFAAENPIVISNTSVNVLNKKGKIIRTEYHNLNNPKCKSKGIRSIVYDIGGNKFRIESAAKTILEKEIDRNIISADISSNGTYGILIEPDSGYLSKAVIYNSNGEEKYNYSFSEYHACDITLNSSSTNCLISGVDIENGNINSMIYILDFKSEKPKNTFKLENNIVSSVKYFSNGNILAIGDKYTSVINPVTGNIKNFNYESKYMKLYSFSEEYGVFLCISPSLGKGKNDEIILIDTLGNVGNPIFTTENLKSVSHFKNRITGLSENDKIIVYDLDGHFEGYIDLEFTAKKIYMCSDSTIYVAKEKSLEKIKINNLKKHS